MKSIATLGPRRSAAAGSVSPESLETVAVSFMKPTRLAPKRS